MKRDNKLLFILIAISCVIVVSAFMIVRYFRNNYWFENGIGYRESSSKLSVNEEKKVSIQNINEINISSVSADIKIIKTDDKDMRVHYYGNFLGGNTTPQLIVDTSDNSINVSTEHNILRSFHGRLNIDVYLPKDYNKSLTCSTVSGDITSDNLNVDNFSCKTTSGNIDADSIKSNKNKFDTVSGDIDIKKLSGDVTFATVSGEANISYDKFSNNIEGKSVSGDINIDIPKSSQFKISSHSVSGDINVKFAVTVSGSIEKHSLEGTVGSGDGNIKVNTTSGDIRVE